MSTHLHGVLVGQEVDDLQGVLDDASRHELLTAVAALAHQGAAKALHDGALLCACSSVISCTIQQVRNEAAGAPSGTKEKGGRVINELMPPAEGRHEVDKGRQQMTKAACLTRN